MVREPPKNIFYSPVIVLDFQSLYPSIMIAYNICYTTCLGKLLEEGIDSITSDTYKDDFLMLTNQFKKYLLLIIYFKDLVYLNLIKTLSMLFKMICHLNT
jgi:DNA polymerase zeta